MAFVAQINLADLPTSRERTMLPSRGILTFFCDSQGDFITESAAVGFFPPGAECAPRDLPAGLDEDVWRFGEVQLRAEVTDVPAPPSAIELEALNLSSEERQAYQYDFAEKTQSHRMLGYPEAVQDDPRSGEDELLLLQVDGDDQAGMTWGDAGRIYYLINREDLRHHRFERVRFVFQCH